MRPKLPLLPLLAGLCVAAAAWFFRSRPSTPTPAAPPIARTDSPRRAGGPTAKSVAVPAGGATPTLGVFESTGTASEILTRLATLQVKPSEPHSVRQLILELEKLKQLGAAALPAIAGFLAAGNDVDYDAPSARAGFRDGKVPTEFAVPPSLRLGLLELVKNIGGPDAEALLVRELKSTGRGVEAAYLAGALQEIAPDKYRDASAAAARDLLAMPLTPGARNTLDRADREYLYGVLAAAGDRSQVAQAQAQLLLANGQIDRGALRYLQQMLGEGSVDVAAQAWQDPRIIGDRREPLARVALAYVGASDRAEKLYQAAINDVAMSDAARKNLIEDLNETGFADPKHLTAADLPLIQKRLALIDQLAPRAKDATNAAAFAEAKKDLLKMRDDLLSGAPKKK